MLGLGQRAPASGVRGDRRGLRRRAPGAVEEVGCARERVAEGVRVVAGARQRRQFRLRAQSLGAEPDADLGSPARARRGHAVANGRVGVRPPALPQGQLGDVSVVGRQARLVAHRRPRGFEMRAGGGELAAADLEIGAEHEGHVRVVGGDRPKRGGARVVRPVPLPDREQGLDPVRGQHGVVRLVCAHCLEPFLPEPRRLGRPPEHREHVGERDVRSMQSQWVSELLGELQGLPELRETLVAAAEIREAAAEHRERPALRLPRADGARERERLLAERERLLVAPEQLQPARDVPPAPARAVGDGGCAGTSSSARSDAARKVSPLPLSNR